jgi:predicted glycogen debranching enzyme
MDINYSKQQLDDCFLNEWLETNQAGSYASSSLACLNTRKYHGLLVSHNPEHGGDYVLLSKLEPSIFLDEKEYNLGVNQYPGTIYPQGYKYMESFSPLPFPQSIYEIKEVGIKVAQEIQMPMGKNGTLIRYRILKAPKAIKIRIYPLLAFRNVHTLTKSNFSLNPRVEKITDKLIVYKLHPYPNLPELFFTSSTNFEFFPSPRWNANVEYAQEQKRGFDFQEDLFCPGIIEQTLGEGEEITLQFCTNFPTESPETLWTLEDDRRKQMQREFKTSQDLIGTLKMQSRHLITKDEISGWSIIAGRPWFGIWGRDTMIALPGLTFYSGRIELGIEILKNYCKYEKNGLLPNYLPSKKGESPSYNSIDASLWFFWTLQEYLKITGDVKILVKNFSPILYRITKSYLESVPECLSRNSNDLLWTGNENTQITWMDARANGVPVTPRHGLAVEINALWYNALCFMDNIQEHFAKEHRLSLKSNIKQLDNSFNETFWMEDKGYLADVVNEKGQDASLRPNQIFAVSLPYSPINKNRGRKIITAIEKDLLTPVGLRTLSPKDSSYRGRYEGGPERRDSSYHQGTVWPWPIGHYCEGYLKVAENKKNAAKFLLNYFHPLYKDHLKEYGVLSIAEIFDGDEPRRPGGCPFQAWSVGEAIRAFEILNIALEEKK